MLACDASGDGEAEAVAGFAGVESDEAFEDASALVFGYFTETNEHLVFFKGSADGTTWLVVTRFGSLSFGVPVDSSGRPVPEDAWRLDWRKPTKDGSTTRAQILMDAAERVVVENNPHLAHPEPE